mgnify:CR=1 FL=1
MIAGQKTAAGLLLISVFLAGVMGGMVGVKMMDRRAWRDPGERSRRFDHPGEKPPWVRGTDRGAERHGLMPMWISDRLAEELELSDTQREQVRAIFDTRRERADEALKQIGPILRAELDSMNLEIREILSPEQALLFDEFQEREGDRMFRRMSNPSRGSPTRDRR